MLDLTPPRHVSTLREADIAMAGGYVAIGRIAAVGRTTATGGIVLIPRAGEKRIVARH
jgi:hypothetical protein